MGKVQALHLGPNLTDCKNPPTFELCTPLLLPSYVILALQNPKSVVGMWVYARILSLDLRGLAINSAV
jgi:hypothetical protein